MAKKRKTSAKTLAKRKSKLSNKKQRMFRNARLVADIVKKVKAGGKLSKKDARTLRAHRKYQAKHRKQSLSKMTPEQRRGLKKAQKAYTPAKRRRAAMLAWVTRRAKYGACGRADPSTFKKSGKKAAGKKASSKKSGGKKGGKKASSSKKTSTKKSLTKRVIDKITGWA